MAGRSTRSLAIMFRHHHRSAIAGITLAAAVCGCTSPGLIGNWRGEIGDVHRAYFALSLKSDGTCLLAFGGVDSWEGFGMNCTYIRTGDRIELFEHPTRVSPARPENALKLFYDEAAQTLSISEGDLIVTLIRQKGPQ